MVKTEKAWNGTGELLHEGIFWYGASFTRAETGVSLGTPKILGTGDTFGTFGTDTFTRPKSGVPCLKIVSTVPKTWLAAPLF